MLHWLVGIFAQNAVLGIFLSLFVGSALFPLPTEILLPLAGIVVREGHVRFWFATVVAITAQMLGCIAAYLAGRHGGRPVIDRYGKYVFLGHKEMAFVDRWVASYGELGVIATRMLGFRVPVSVACGVAQMPFLRYVLYTFLGVTPWSIFFIWLGYQVGRIWEHPAWRPFWRIAWMVLGVLAAAWWVGLALKRRRQDQG